MTEPDQSRPVPSGQQPRRRSSFRFALVTAGAGLVVAVLVFVLVANNIGSGDGSSGVRTSASLFEVGQAASLADTVRRGGPLLLPDVVGRSRDIYVQHLGGDDWRAFDARAAGASRRCTLRWQAAPRTFVDPCDNRTYPEDGTGLTSYPARVDESGRLIVDLRSPATTTTSSPSTTTTAAPPSSSATTPGA